MAPGLAGARAPGAAQAQESRPRVLQRAYLIVHPGRAGWQGLLESESPSAAQEQDSPPTACSPGGASGEHLPGKTPLYSPVTHIDSCAGAAALSLPWHRGCHAHPQPGPPLQLPQAEPVPCLPGGVRPCAHGPPNPDTPAGQLPWEGVQPPCIYLHPLDLLFPSKHPWENGRTLQAPGKDEVAAGKEGRLACSPQSWAPFPWPP